MRQSAVALLFFVVTAITGAATPEDVVMTYFEKVSSEGLGSIGALMHPEELKKMHDMMTPALEQMLSDGETEAVKEFVDQKDPKKHGKRHGKHRVMAVD